MSKLNFTVYLIRKNGKYKSKYQPHDILYPSQVKFTDRLEDAEFYFSKPSAEALAELKAEVVTLEVIEK